MMPGSKEDRHNMMNSATRTSLSKSTLSVLILGVGLLVAALTWTGSSVVATRSMTTADGTVVRFDHGNRSLRSYQPVIAFMTPGGRREELAAGTSLTQPAYDIGQAVRIYYDPTRPERPAIIDDFGQRWFPIAVLALLGCVFSGVGVLFYLGDRPRISSLATPSYAERKRKRNRQNLMVSLIPIVVGAAFLLCAARSFMHEREMIRGFNRAKGHVVSVLENEQPYKPRSFLYSAVVVFKTNTGQQITFAQGSSSSHNDLREGEEVDVLYDEGTPERAVIDSFWEHWGLTAILIAIGLPFFAVGVFFVGTIDFARRPRKRTS
jgi:hypothetical protein